MRGAIATARRERRITQSTLTRLEWVLYQIAVDDRTALDLTLEEFAASVPFERACAVRGFGRVQRNVVVLELRRRGIFW